MATDANSVRDLVAEFCRRTDIAPKTRQAYRDHLARFLPWAEAQGATAPEQLVPDLIDAYARELERHRTAKGTPLTPASRRAYLKGVQQFLSWLRQRHRVEGVEPRAVQLPRLRRRRREVLTREEVQRLEDAAPTERNKLIIRLMADTGTREGGIPGILLEDLVTIGGGTFVRVRDKTGERLPPVRPELFRRLRAHAAGKTGRPRTSNPHLFLSSRRRAHGDYEPLTEDGVYGVIKDAAERAELGRRVYPHLLKHSAITWMVTRGMHPALISEITGTSVQVISQFYSHPSDEERYQAMMTLLQRIDA